MLSKKTLKTPLEHPKLDESSLRMNNGKLLFLIGLKVVGSMFLPKANIFPL